MADTREATIKALEKRLKKQPRSPLFARLASIYLEDGRTDDALRICNDGVAHHPFYTTGHLVKGKVLQAMNNPADARKEYNLVYELRPSIETVARMLNDVGGPIEPEPEAPAAEAPAVPEAAVEELQSLESVAVEEAPSTEVSAPAAEPAVAEPITEAPVAPPVDETLEEFSARMRQELAGTENTLSLEDYLSGNIPAVPSNSIEGLAQKLQGAKMAPVIDLTAKSSGGGGAGFVTPTLAEIYVKQGWFDDAIKAYKSLAASKPEEKENYERRIAEIEAMKSQQQ
ncbi:MAG TPA: hypothetical protein VII11_04595 [Bacteroidota bacterium]